LVVAVVAVVVNVIIIVIVPPLPSGLFIVMEKTILSRLP
jgi:hypothetical protein